MKSKLFYLLLVPILLFSSCQKGNMQELSFQEGSPIIFSEFQRGNSADTRIVEIANIGTEKVELNDYYIAIYHGITTEIEKKIELKNYNLEPNETLVIAYDKCPQEVLDKADIITSDLMVDGTWPIALCKGNNTIDVLGKIGYQTEYGKYIDLVRKKEFMIGRKEIKAYDWINYCADDYSHLGTIETTISEEELLAGPKLSAADFNKPFADDNGYGCGGAVKVTLAYTGDGDTTNFNFPSSVRQYGVNSRHSVRYIRINTPEIQHGTSIDAQPWGEAAKAYNNDVLDNAKAFAIQTETGQSLFDTYERLLAYVWYANVSNPAPEDYICLNSEMLVQGLAFLYFYEEAPYAKTNLYKQVSYTNILKNNELYAKEKGIKVHGERDPNFNY